MSQQFHVFQHIFVNNNFRECPLLLCIRMVRDLPLGYGILRCSVKSGKHKLLCYF